MWPNQAEREQILDRGEGCYDYVGEYEWEVLNELGLDLEQNTQGSWGSVEIFSEGDYENAVSIDYGFYTEVEEELFLDSESAEEFKEGFENFILSQID